MQNKLLAALAVASMACLIACGSGGSTNNTGRLKSTGGGGGTGGSIPETSVVHPNHDTIRHFDSIRVIRTNKK